MSQEVVKGKEVKRGVPIRRFELYSVLRYLATKSSYKRLDS